MNVAIREPDQGILSVLVAWYHVTDLRIGANILTTYTEKAAISNIQQVD